MNRQTMRRLVLTSLAAASLAAAVLAPIGTGVSRGQPAPTATAGAQRDACTVRTDKVARPATITLGETVDVTLTAQISCPATAVVMDLVLALDGSGSMAGPPLELMKAAASDVVRGLELSKHPRIRVAVIQYNTSARLWTALTNDERRVYDAINRVGARGGTRTDLAFLTAMRALGGGDGSVRDDCVPRVVVLLSDGGDNSGCAPAQRTSAQAQSRGIDVVSIALGLGADQACAQSLASRPAYYHYAPTATDLQAAFGAVLEQLRALAQSTAYSRLSISDPLGADVAYVPGSASPPGVHGPGRAITWSWGYPPATALTLTLQVTPTRTGRVPTNGTAVGTITSCLGHETVFAFGVPVVEVLAPATIVPPPTIAPTPTSTAATTATQTATMTPTMTATPIAPPTAVPTTATGPSSCYLPVVARYTVGLCTVRPVEAALVVDVSPSMAESYRPGGAAKLDAVREALSGFAAQIDPAAGHAAALVTFDDAAHLLQQLSTDPTELSAVIADLSPGTVGSRLDLGIGAARHELTGPRHLAGRSSVLVVLTDGRAEPHHAQAAIAEAELARSGGIRVFVIGLGADQDLHSLRRVAGTTQYMSVAAASTDLPGIVRAVWDDMRCP